MIIQFSTANFRSIADEQTLSFEPTGASEHRKSNLIQTSSARYPELLKFLVIYGANASGKTNLLRALEFMQSYVAQSDDMSWVSEKGKRTPFRIDPSYTDKPSTFEIVLVVDGVSYQYGFSLSDTKVEEEWLYAYPTKKRQVWFERYQEKGETAWRFGSNFVGQKKVWQKSTRKDALFLTIAANLNSKQLLPIVDWFAEKLRIVLAGNLQSAYTKLLCEDDAISRTILYFLRQSDPGISNLRVVRQIQEELKLSLPEDMPLEVRKTIQNTIRAERELKVEFLHQSKDGNGSWIGLGDESGGTQRLFGFAGPLIDVMDNERVLVVDELNNSLHPLLVKQFLKFFGNKNFNKGNAQLVFTSHATSILDTSILRRDQVVFLEKQNDLKSTVTFLDEFKPRKSEAIEKAYLKGRYGAIPLFH